MDISDRAYEPAVVKLLDGAKESIVISMYAVSFGAKNKGNPLELLIGDLFEARKRGVEVTLYLNTRFNEPAKIREQLLIENPLLKKLEDAGTHIYLMPINRRVHDKLIIVDSRYVVDGSTNWSISALRVNYESATLIDSPGLAKAKLARLEARERESLASKAESKDARDDLPAGSEGKSKEEKKRTALYTEKLPEYISIPADLLTDQKYCAQMVNKADGRALELYLLLLAHSQVTGQKEFFIDLESMGLSLGLPEEWKDTDLRRQVIRSLKRLEARYNLLTARFFHGKDAQVTLADLSHDAFNISVSAVNPGLSERARYFLIVKAYLEAKGEDISKISDSALAERFHVSRRMLCDARKDANQP
jgi:hypothetical protein